MNNELNDLTLQDEDNDEKEDRYSSSMSKLHEDSFSDSYFFFISSRKFLDFGTKFNRLTYVEQLQS